MLLFPTLSYKYKGWWFEPQARLYFFIPLSSCRTIKKALLLEVTCDFGKNILKLIIYSFNLKLFDFHVADFDETESEMLNEYSSMLRNDIEIADELNQITESLDFQKFVATFHLKIIHKVLVDHYNFQKGGHVKPSFSNKRPVELFDSRKGDIFLNLTFYASKFDLMRFLCGIIDTSYKVLITQVISIYYETTLIQNTLTELISISMSSL